VDAALALDTGATTTLISPHILIAAGYDPSTADEHVFITSATAIVYVPKFAIAALEALGMTKPLRVLATGLPPSAGVDGLLGLDFFRDQVLTLNFRNGLITLA
jgi:hypothetical protein